MKINIEENDLKELVNNFAVIYGGNCYISGKENEFDNKNGTFGLPEIEPLLEALFRKIKDKAKE